MTATNINGRGGLVNYLAPTGQISNLTMTGTMSVVYTNAPTCTTDVDGISVFGGVVGYNCGVIDNVTNKVVITNSTGTADASYSTDTEIYNVGGIAGFNDAFYQSGAKGTIRNCTNDANITGYEKVGGITGENAGLIASCLNSENAKITPTSTRRSGAGGIAGRNGNNNTAAEAGVIRGCANYGNIISGVEGNEDSQSSWLGGIAGWLNTKSSILNCYNKGNLLGYGYAGYIAGGTGYTTDDGETDYTGGITYCYTDTSCTGATGLTEGTSHLLGVNGVSIGVSDLANLNTDNAGYGSFELESNYPMPQFDATATAGAAEGWELDQPTVYLDPSATTNGTGLSASSPYNNLNDAINAAGLGKIYVMSSISITSNTTMWDSIEFIRYTGNNFTGPMFIINAPDSNDRVTYVTMSSAVVNGSNVGTLFQVNQGRLRLRGNMVLKNAVTGVTVDATSTSVQAQLELNEAYIQTTTAVIVGGTNNATIANDSLIYNAFGNYTNKFSGNIVLGANSSTKAFITVESAITCPMVINYPSPVSGDIVLKATDDYEITSTDLSFVSLTSGAKLELSSEAKGNSAVVEGGDDD
jgi:hypothetical protein